MRALESSKALCHHYPGAPDRSSRCSLPSWTPAIPGRSRFWKIVQLLNAATSISRQPLPWWDRVCQDFELRRRRKSLAFLENRPQVGLAATLKGVHALLAGDDNIAVEIDGALLEFGEILDRLQGALRSKDPLDVQTAQRHPLNAVAELLRTGVGGEVSRAVFWAVRMAIKASRAKAGNLRAAILGRIEVLLRECPLACSSSARVPGDPRSARLRNSADQQTSYWNRTIIPAECNQPPS
jgi:hypothetical protein